MSTLLSAYDGVPDSTNATAFEDIWLYIEDQRGPQQLPLEVAVPLTVINGLILITGIFGNIAVCAVIIKHPSLHTATNYYLLNLAISDLTLLIFGLPNDVSVYWHQYPWTLGEGFCKIRTLISETATYGSVLTIVAFSSERYIAICHPLYKHAMLELQRVYKIIAFIWLISLLSASPFAMYTNVDFLTHPNDTNIILKESAFCAMTSQPENVPLAELSTLIFFLIPMVIISLEYIKMGQHIAKNSEKKLLNGSVHRGSKKSQSQKTIIKMLSAVVIGFFICWAPFHAQRLLFIYGQESPYYEAINAWMFYITGILYYFSSTLNPILYNVMSKRYRNAFKEVIFHIKKRSVFRRGSSIREYRRASRLSETSRIVPHFDSTREKENRNMLPNACDFVSDEKANLVKEQDDHFLTSCKKTKGQKNGSKGFHKETRI